VPNSEYYVCEQDGEVYLPEFLNRSPKQSEALRLGTARNAFDESKRILDPHDQEHGCGRRS
jgi:hypothetical protein